MNRLPRLTKALILMLTALALRMPLGMLLRQWLGTDDHLALYYTAVIVQELVLWGLPALLLRPWRIARAAKPAASVKTLLLAAAAGVCAQVCLAQVTQWWTTLIPTEASTVQLPANGAQWVLGALALSVIPAFTEEAFFRGGLTAALGDGVGGGTAFVLSTAVFALMHGSLSALPAHLTVSAICTLLMLCEGRVEGSMLFHLTYNGAALLLGRADMPHWTVTAACALAVVGFGVLLARKIDRRSHGRMSGMERGMMAVLLFGMALNYLPELLHIASVG